MQYVVGHNLFDRPVPTSLLQLWVPRVELHLFYNTIVFIPMVVAIFPHVPACRGEAGRVHVRLAPEAVTGGVNARLTLLCGWACCAIALATGCGGRPADVGIAWTIEPSALVAGSTATRCAHAHAD